MVYTAGLNIVALSPPPLGSFSVLVSVVTNAPVPVRDTDFIQIGRENMDVLLDYGVHLAVFKQGFSEVKSTMDLYERMLKAAQVYNSKISAFSPYWEAISTVSEEQEKHMPRVTSA